MTFHIEKHTSFGMLKTHTIAGRTGTVQPRQGATQVFCFPPDFLASRKGQDDRNCAIPYRQSSLYLIIDRLFVLFFKLTNHRHLSVTRTNLQNSKQTAPQVCSSQHSSQLSALLLPLSEESSFLERIFLFRPRLPFFVSPPFSPSPPSRPEQLSACLAIVFYSMEEKNKTTQQKKKQSMH